MTVEESFDRQEPNWSELSATVSRIAEKVANKLSTRTPLFGTKRIRTPRRTQPDYDEPWQSGSEGSGATVGDGMLRRQLLDGALGKVFEAYRQYDSSQGNLETWIYRVLLNYAIDLARKAGRKGTPRQMPIVTARDDGDPDQPENRKELDVVDDRTPRPDEMAARSDTLPRKTLETLERILSARDCLILTVLGGLWHRVSDEFRDRWREKAGVDTEFPPADVFLSESEGERQQVIGASLGISRAAVAMALSRAKSKLTDAGLTREDFE